MLKYFFFFFLFISLGAQAQIDYENGYIIENNGIRKNVKIKDKKWNNNPEKITVIYESNSDPTQIYPSDILEFGIGEDTKFMTKQIQVYSNKISNSQDPEFVDKTIFLKVLLSGDFGLYSYKSKNNEIYYYQKESSRIVPLLHNEYINKKGKTVENNSYKKQLLEEFQCNKEDIVAIRKLKYFKQPVIKFFKNYAKCSNRQIQEYNQKLKIGQFNFYAGVGANSFSPSVEIVSNNIELDQNSDENISFNPAIELEYVFPYHGNKWALFISPNYQSYDVQFQSDQNFQFNFDAIVIPIGVRHYFYLNNNTRFFADVALASYVTLNSNFSGQYITPERPPSAGLPGRETFASVDDELDFVPKPIFSIGAKFKDIGIRLSYDPKFPIYENRTYKASLSAFTLGVNYKIFEF